MSPQHDLDLANNSGAAFRADLNLALEALQTNSSGATEIADVDSKPYQFWADTDSSIMKMRNGADNAWVSLFNLDGSSLGPGKVTFGATEVVFNDAGNDVDFRIEGDTEANLFFVDASTDRVGIGTTSAAGRLHISDGSSGQLSPNAFANTLIVEDDASNGISILTPSTGIGSIFFGDESDNFIGGIRYDHTDNSFQLYANNSERAQIDSSGRLLVGTSTARTDFLNTTTFGSTAQIETVTTSSRGLAITNNSSGNSEALLFLNKANGSNTGSSTVVSINNRLGSIYFQGADGSELVAAALISAEVDGTPGSNDMPGRLVFSTTADATSSPTERMRIGANAQIQMTQPNSSVGSLYVNASSTSFSANVLQVLSSRAASSAYSLIGAYSGAGADKEFDVRGDGQVTADGSFTSPAADYAEFFEWSDGNTDAEDRRGISVVLDGDKIRKAVAGEEPIGVISGNPSVIGDADNGRWKNKYLRDDFGTYIWEDYEVEDEDGNTVTQQRRKLNPDYDPDVEYINREDRPEWDCVGLMGKLRIRKGQPTGSRWIKMRDISATVEEWLVR